MKGYRTIIFNILVAILPILETIEVSNLFDTYGDTATAGYALFIIIGNAVLRFMTDTEIGESE